MVDRAEMSQGFRQKRASVPQFAIIADDLTGACDAAVPFAHRGLRTLVSRAYLDRVEVDADALAISTETRDVAHDIMRQRVTAAFNRFSGSDHVFKKIDSVFRGNTFIEIAHALQLMPDATVAIAPAFPALNRICVDGVQEVRDIVGERRLPLYDCLQKVGVEARVISRNTLARTLKDVLRTNVEAGQRIFLFDSECQEDLGCVVDAVSKLSEKTLWIGSGGLALSLAESISQTVAAHAPPIGGSKTVFCVGSDHSVTQMQLDRLLLDRTITDRSILDGDLTPDSTQIVCRIPRGAVRNNHIIRFIERIGIAEIGCIFVTGGDTASFLCEALDVKAIEIRHEFAPGVPMGVIQGGPLDGITIILKSGGFGDADLLSQIARTYSTKARVDK
jgi:uncharacterized protein YgbK (DUF1537 family)